MSFVPGWTPESHQAAHERAVAAGIPIIEPHPLLRAGPSRPGYSLTRFRRRHLEQGQAGTCWLHAAVQRAELLMRSAHLEADFDICRRLVGYGGKAAEGGGNPTNGGNGIDALLAMSDDGQYGLGIAHEELLPYTDSGRALGTKPPQNVFDDAKPLRLFSRTLIKPQNDFASFTALLDNDTPFCCGIWWPNAWDGQGQSVFTSAGWAGGFGHELLICGYAQAGVLHSEPCIQLDNWHGLLYPRLAAAPAAQVEGYTPIGPNTSDFWVTWSAWQAAVQKSGQWVELVTMTDSNGVKALSLAEAIAL